MLELISEKKEIAKNSDNQSNKISGKFNNKIAEDNDKSIDYKKSNDIKTVITIPPKSISTNNPLNLLKETANLRKNMIPQTIVDSQARDLSSVRLSNMTNQSVVPEFYQGGIPSEKGKLNNPDELIGKRSLDLSNEFRKMNKLSPLK